MWRGACTRGQLIGPTGVNQPLEQTQQAPRNYNLSQARIQFSVSNSACPRGRGRDSHTDARTHSQIRSHTHARRYTRANTHIHLDAHLLSPPPPPGRSTGVEGWSADPCVLSTASTCVFTCPDETVIFRRRKFSCAVCLSPLKVQSSHEIKLKAMEQSMKTFAIHGALPFLELKYMQEIET